MAKPGSEDAAAISSGLAVDLSRLGKGKPLDLQRLELERKLGMRCGGCKRRITVGFEFVTFAVVELKGAVDKLAAPRTYACTHDDCDYAQRVAPHANAMRQIEWAYLDEQRGEKVPGAANPEREALPG
jgi:hypothetical protein